MSACHTTKKKASKGDGSRPRLTILPGVGLVDLDDPRLSQQLAERLAGKVGDELLLFAQRMREALLAASVAIGLEVMGQLMEAEVTDVAGPKGKHNKDDHDHLAALPDSAWTTHTIKRAGRYRHSQIHEEIVHLKGIEAPLRHIAIRNIGREEPTLLITDGPATPTKDLFARHAERMIIENELDADISGLHLNALSSGVPLNVDVDTTLTVLAGNCYRCSPANCPATDRWTCPGLTDT